MNQLEIQEAMKALKTDTMDVIELVCDSDGLFRVYGVDSKDYPDSWDELSGGCPDIASALEDARRREENCAWDRQGANQ